MKHVGTYNICTYYVRTIMYLINVSDEISDNGREATLTSIFNFDFPIYSYFDMLLVDFERCRHIQYLHYVRTIMHLINVSDEISDNCWQGYVQCIMIQKGSGFEPRQGQGFSSSYETPKIPGAGDSHVFRMRR
jgi:hypothetical protein